jgi:hypothetical protein
MKNNYYQGPTAFGVECGKTYYLRGEKPEYETKEIRL